MKRSTKRSIWAMLLVALTAACGGGDSGAGTTTTAVATTAIVKVSTTAATSTTAPDASVGYTDKNESPVTTDAGTTTTTDAVTTTSVPTTTTSTTAAATTTVAPAAGRTVTVAANSFSFSPNTITINVGDTVQWILSAGIHTTTSGTPATPDGNWDQAIGAEAPVEVTFDQAGQFPYFCRPHAAFMTGVVVVEP